MIFEIKFSITHDGFFSHYINKYKLQAIYIEIPSINKNTPMSKSSGCFITTWGYQAYRMTRSTGILTTGESGSLLLTLKVAVYALGVRPAELNVTSTTTNSPAGTVPEMGSTLSQAASSLIFQSNGKSPVLLMVIGTVTFASGRRLSFKDVGVTEIFGTNCDTSKYSGTPKGGVSAPDRPPKTHMAPGFPGMKKPAWSRRVMLRFGKA
jgi:hypothetical protein